MNTILIFGAGLIPLVIGFLWYNNAFGFGKTWMAENGFNEEDIQKNFNPIKVFGVTYIFGVMIATMMLQLTIHQMGLSSMLQGVDGVKDSSTEVGKAFAYLMDTYGQNFRSFKHGALHGTISAIFFAMPVIGINGLFERKSFKYIFIHAGYWIVTLALMGGVICQFFEMK